MLTAIIRYTTPYKNSEGNSLLLSFALGDDVSTNTIFGLPTLDALKLVWDISSDTALSQTCDATFPIKRRGSRRGLPDGVTFDPAEFKRALAATSVLCPTPVDSTELPIAHAMQVIDVHDDYAGNTLTKRSIDIPS
jgi:hypothetical protein